jgi:hypothetical protein
MSTIVIVMHLIFLLFLFMSHFFFSAQAQNSLKVKYSLIDLQFCPSRTDDFIRNLPSNTIRMLLQ